MVRLLYCYRARARFRKLYVPKYVHTRVIIHRGTIHRGGTYIRQRYCYQVHQAVVFFASECPNDFVGSTRSRTRCFCQSIRFRTFGVQKFGELTSSFNSGNPPSVFLSHINIGGSLPILSHTRKRPAVSLSFRGSSVIPLRAGGGNVRKSSVESHVAR